MPQIATQLQNRNRKLVAYDRGMSITSENLSESFISSMIEFFSLSEVIHHSPGFAVELVSILRKPLRDILIQVRNLLSLGENWNSYQALAPDPNAVAHAEIWIVSLFQTVMDMGLFWIKPSVTASSEGEVVFEWWYGKRKLTIYVGVQSIDYVQVWGTDINAKITDGDIESISDCRSLWVWLTS